MSNDSFVLRWPKVCSVCGRTHSDEKWESLPYLGTMPINDDESLELRSCTCGNDLAQPMTMEVINIHENARHT